MSGPGKFEGGPEWVEEYWDASLDGGGDGSATAADRFYTWFRLSDDDAKSWPDLRGVYGIILSERSDGFVEAEEYVDQKSFDEATAELEAMEAGEDDEGDEGDEDDDDDDDDDDNQAQFTYWIDHDERGEFHASVNNPDGKTVFEIDEEIFDDGFMRDKNDLLGLREHLISLGIMSVDDGLIKDR